MDSNYSDKKLIVVLGMHRSGTSAITRGLEVLGVDLGRSFVPEGFDNERGFWEDIEIVHFNEELQQQLGYNWYGSTVINNIDWAQDEVIAAKTKATALLEQKVLQSDVYGFKDPRTAVLLEFWEEIIRGLELSPNFLIVLRNPLSVAESLHKRNGIPKEKSLLLWAASIFQSISLTRNEPRIIVDYDELLQSPLDQLKRISSAFKLADVDEKSDATQYYCDRFLTKDLNHSDHSGPSLNDDDDVLPVIADLYALLNKVATDQILINSTVFNDKFDRLFNRYTEIIPLLKYLNYIDDARLVLENELYKTQTELNDLGHASTLEIKNELYKTQTELNDLGHASTLEIRNAHEAIEKIRSTYSWKVTKPLRLISKYILKK